MMTPPHEAIADEVASARREEVFTVTSRDGKHWLAGVAKRTYSFKSGRLELADTQAPLVVLPGIETDDTGTMTKLLDDLDLVAAKTATDVVVHGTVRLPARATRHRIAVSVGRSARALELVGARRAHVGARTQVTFDDPAPFTELALDLSAAYGGHDAYAQLACAGAKPWLPGRAASAQQPHGPYAYPRNPIGLGYFIDLERRRADGAQLPRIEDPDDPLVPTRFFVRRARAWIDAPVPGNLGFTPYHCYPRMARLAGPIVAHDPPTRNVSESRFEDGEDLHGSKLNEDRGLQGAAPGLAVERLRGAESVRLEGMFAESPELAFPLPGERPRIQLRMPELAAVTPDADLQTVRIDLEQRTLSMTWLARTRVAFRVPPDELRRCAVQVEWRRSN